MTVLSVRVVDLGGGRVVLRLSGPGLKESWEPAGVAVVEKLQMTRGQLEMLSRSLVTELGKIGKEQCASTTDGGRYRCQRIPEHGGQHIHGYARWTEKETQA